MPVLFLHASGAGPVQWRPYVSRLPGPLLMPDLRGRWSEPRPAWTQADDLHEVLSLVDQHPGPLDIVGHSYGGTLALEVALARAQRVRHLFVHEPVLWGCYRVLATPAEVQGFEQGVAGVRRAQGSPEWMRAFVDFWGGQGAFEGLQERRRQDLLEQGYKLFAQVQGLIDDPRVPEYWEQLPPFHLSVGLDTPLEQKRCMTLVSEALPQATLLRVPGAHMAPITHPLAFKARVLELLNTP